MVHHYLSKTNARECLCFFLIRINMLAKVRFSPMAKFCRQWKIITQVYSSLMVNIVISTGRSDCKSGMASSKNRTNYDDAAVENCDCFHSQYPN
jgi:penicillin-binding protein-related factor A (putative recombinase)